MKTTLVKLISPESEYSYRSSCENKVTTKEINFRSFYRAIFTLFYSRCPVPMCTKYPSSDFAEKRVF